MLTKPSLSKCVLAGDPTQASHRLYLRKAGRIRTVRPGLGSFKDPSTTRVSAQASMQLTQRSVWSITKQGSLSNLSVLKEPVPELLPGQALVAVKAIGLNFADVFCCLGLYQAAPPGAFVPGLEFAGEVVDVREPHVAAPGSTPTAPSFRPGNRVLGVTRFGAFTTHIALDTRYLRSIPASWSYQEAASFPVQTLTAAYGLFSCGGLRKGSTVLVQAAAGGVGLQALHLLQKLQCNVLGLTSSEDKVQLLNIMYSSQSCNTIGPDIPSSKAALVGATDNISSSRSSSGTSSRGDSPKPQGPAMQFLTRELSTSAIRAQLSTFLSMHHLQGFDIILDSVAGPYFQPSYDALNPCGRHVIFGAAALTPPPGVSLEKTWGLLAPWNLLAAVKLLLGWLNRPKLDVIAMPGHNKGVVGFNLIWLYDQIDLMTDLYDQVEQLQLQPPLVGKEFHWEQLPEALSFLQSGRSVGKVVVTINDNGE